MNRTTYYEEMKFLARETRTHYGLDTPRVLKSDLRRIYKDQGILIDPCKGRLKNLRGAYFSDDLGASVLIAASLPDEPKIFTLAHELKHHLVDRSLAAVYCADTNENDPIEIGAEVFAAEFIFPEPDFIRTIEDMGIEAGQCDPEVVVRLKHESGTTLSYAGCAKRAEFLRFAPKGSLHGVRWKKLEEQIYGEPIYKRINRARQRRQLAGQIIK